MYALTLWNWSSYNTLWQHVAQSPDQAVLLAVWLEAPVRDTPSHLRSPGHVDLVKDRASCCTPRSGPAPEERCQLLWQPVLHILCVHRHECILNHP
jgi:hypothetical protein